LTVNEKDDVVNANIVIEGGIIMQIGVVIVPPPGAPTIDGPGRYLTPGLVDLHNHLGNYPYPFGSGNLDVNEILTQPNNPQLRSMVSILYIQRSLCSSVGITSSLVLPGRGNVMGGQAAYIKLRGK